MKILRSWSEPEDIVGRLRDRHIAVWGGVPEGPRTRDYYRRKKNDEWLLEKEAADEIVRLRQRLADAVEVLREIAECLPEVSGAIPYVPYLSNKTMNDKARDVLARLDG